ncbi:MAG: DUF6754 domain-containing protein [Pseudomonadota bacterium]
MKKILLISAVVILSIPVFLVSSAKVNGTLKAIDTPDDGGKSVTLSWDITDAKFIPVTIEILRGDAKDAPFTTVATIEPGETTYADKTTIDGTEYFYRIALISKWGTKAFIDADASVISKPQWFDTKMTYFLILALIITVAILYYIETSRRGKKYYIRKIAGLDAIEEAIGRATEMGRPILYIPGIQDMDDVQTMAGLNILSMVSQKVAEYDTPIMVPTCRSLVMTTAREIVKGAFLAAGRPDAYNEQNIFYVTDEQFAFVAHVNGLMVRDKPATCFYMGAFFAESLILAEIGNSVGAIQIAGTAMPSQLPFFIAACDYTLIGEELFAASAYLSQSPQEIGSLKGQDLGKLVAMFVIGLGAISATIASYSGSAVFNQITDFVIKFFTTV